MAQPTAPRKRITLADLSDDERRSLLEEAREASRRNPTDVDGYDDLSPREKAIRSLMDARDHMRGCPVQEGTELGRVEGYDATRPANPATGRPAATMAIIRCVECGGSSVLDEPPTPLEDALLTEAVVVDGGQDDETP